MFPSSFSFTNSYQVIQATHQCIRFAWNSQALQFKLRVISWGSFMSDEYSTPVYGKQAKASEY